MIPAVEGSPDTPPPAAQEPLLGNDAAMVPARTRGASTSLEKLRNRMRSLIPQDAQWMDASQMPIDQGTGAYGQQARPTMGRRAPESPEAQPANRSITNGAALTTLMRSAARQYTPAPALAGPQRMSRSVQVAAPSNAPSQPQMRGALRRVVRTAQQAPSTPVVMPSVGPPL